LNVALVWPPRDDDVVAIAHAELAERFRDMAICSVPLLSSGHAAGVLTFERRTGQAFDRETIELCKTIGGLLGPILQLKQDSGRSLMRHAGDSLHWAAQVLVG